MSTSITFRRPLCVQAIEIATITTKSDQKRMMKIDTMRLRSSLAVAVDVER